MLAILTADTDINKRKLVIKLQVIAIHLTHFPKIHQNTGSELDFIYVQLSNIVIIYGNNEPGYYFLYCSLQNCVISTD